MGIVDNYRRQAPTFLAILAILWRSAMLLLIPITAAIVVLVPLANTTKSTRVDIGAVTSNVSFSLLSGWQAGQDIEFIRSAASHEVRLWIDSISIYVDTLFEEGAESRVLKNQTVTFRGKSENSWVSFKVRDQELYLLSLYVGGDSRIYLRTGIEKLVIDIQSNSWLDGSISLPGTDISICAYNCEVTANTGDPVVAMPEAPQHRFVLRTGPTAVSLSSSNGISIELHFAPENSESLNGAFSEYLRVKDLRFLPERGEAIVPISEGWIDFPSLNRDRLNLRSDFVRIPAENIIDIVAIKFKADLLELLLSGEINSLKVGKLPEPEEEVLPSWLEWLYDHRKLGVIVGVLVWISGTVLGAINLLGSFQETRRLL